MKWKCVYCGKRFVPTANQLKRARWACTQPKIGFCCSAFCVAMVAVRARKQPPLPPNRLAYSRVNNAIEQGRMLRPVKCEVCRQTPGVDSLGRSKIQGHHHAGYKQALRVVWLCAACHNKISGRKRIENGNAARAFTKKDVYRIRREIEEAKGRRGAINELARQYGVTHKAITDIRDQKTWRHLPCF